MPPSASSAATSEINCSTKDLPAPDADSNATACKGKRFLRDKLGAVIKDAAGEPVIESGWCIIKPCRATYHCKEPGCMAEGRRVDDHLPTCKVLCKMNKAAAARTERLMGNTLFHVDHGRRWVFGTINANGRDAPREWLNMLEAEFKSNPGYGKYYLCRETGKGKEQEHYHWIVECDVVSSDKSHTMHRKHIADLLNAVNCRIQIKDTRTAGEASVTGLLIYLAKDLGKRAFEFRSDHISAADVIENNRLWKENNPEAWADGLSVIQPNDALAWAKTAAKVNGTAGLGGFGNEVLWGVWERSVTFHSKFYSNHGGTALDAERAAVQWKVMTEPENVDEVEVATMLFGSAHVRRATADHCEGERYYPDARVFKREFNTLKRKQALDRSDGGAVDANLKKIRATTVHFHRGAQRQERITLDDLKDWQLKSWDRHLSRAPLRHHRHIRWYHESVGNAGKSFYLAFLAMNAATCHLATDNVRDCLYALGGWMDAHDGQTPHIIAFDLTRSDASSAPYKLLEMLSNGFATSLKYESRVMRLAKCHLVCVSNFPPANDAPISADRWSCDGVSTIVDLRNNDLGFHVSDYGSTAGVPDMPTASAPADHVLELNSGGGSPLRV